MVLGVRGEVLAVPVTDIVISVAMGAVMLATGMVLYTLGSQVVPAAELTLLSMVEVLLAPVWVWLFLGETASAGTFLGGGDPACWRLRAMPCPGAGASRWPRR